MIRFSLALLTVGVLATQPGCKCSNDKPYVPYTIGSTTPTASGGRAAPTASTPVLRPIEGGSAFKRLPAKPAPPGTSTWNVEGIAVTAPPGRYFVSGLVVAPGTVVAFVGDGGSMAGELVRYVTTDNGRVVGPTTLARLPEWLPTGQGCTHLPALSLVGPSTLWLDIASVCKEAQKPNRYLAAVSLKAEGSAVRLDLRVSDPAPGERLAFEADASDRDSDGLDDLLVQVALEGAPTPLTAPATSRATAALKFLARPTGMARESNEPGQALRNQASWVAGQAGKREQAEGALAQARQGRRLQTLLCSEQGAPVVVMGDGAPLPCPEAAGAFEELRFAEGRALATLGQVPGAFMVAAGWRDARKPPRRLADLDTAIEAAAPAKKVNARPLKAMPAAHRVALPMTFDAAGSLLVLTDEGVVSVNPATGDETAATTPRWNPLAELVGDLKVSGGADDCRAGFLAVQVQSGGGPRRLPTGVPGSTGPGCLGELPVILLERGGEGLTALLQGEPVAINKEGDRAQATAWPTGAASPGTARSPDGRWTALASSDRVLLRGPDRSEVWKPTTRFFLTACTAAPDGRAVACLLERGLVLLTP